MVDQQTVVVIGASYGGLCAAKALASTHNVVLIDCREYFELNFAAPRLLQDPELIKSTAKKLSDFPWMSKVTLKIARATEAHLDHVVLDSGESLKFDYLIIASGSTYANEHCKPTKSTLAQRVEDVKSMGDQVKQAKSALVIGGGHTGMEVAAELKEGGVGDVTLVQGPPHLADGAKRGAVHQNRLKKIGVEVILGTRAEAVTPPSPGTSGPGVYTIAGSSRAFDMVFVCVGFKTAHASFVKPLGEISKANGCIDVNQSLQVKGYENIFAVGDAVDVDPDHVAYLACEHGKHAAKAIQLLTSGKPASKLPVWKPSNGFRVTITTLGKKNSLANIGDSTVSKMVPGSMLDMKIMATKKSVGF